MPPPNAWFSSNEDGGVGPKAGCPTFLHLAGHHTTFSKSYNLGAPPLGVLFRQRWAESELSGKFDAATMPIRQKEPFGSSDDG